MPCTFTSSRLFEHDPWLHFPSSAQLKHPKPVLSPHRPAGGVGSQVTLSPFSIFSHTFSIHKKLVFRGLPCLPLSLSLSLFFFKVIFFKIYVKYQGLTPLPSLSHKAGSLCCFTCLNICFMKITHIIDVYVIYIFVRMSDPFLELLPRPISSPLLSTPFLAYCGHTPMPFDPKKGRGKTYFKTDLFYAFVIKANLFSKCAMSEWNWQVI